ncbi:MAG: hypothetical protein JWP03_3919 [Phycisphaerales bacterium]|jgi:hypothetical protein|nr:hypothetical protein [Phycisphaerales bacterium]
MAQVSHALARLKPDPIADLPLGAHLDQLCRDENIVRRERLLSGARKRVKCDYPRGRFGRAADR